MLNKESIHPLLAAGSHFVLLIDSLAEVVRLQIHCAGSSSTAEDTKNRESRYSSSGGDPDTFVPLASISTKAEELTTRVSVSWALSLFVCHDVIYVEKCRSPDTDTGHARVATRKRP